MVLASVKPTSCTAEQPFSRMAFDLPTQLGRDSDDPLCMGEVGRTGVAIDTIEDTRWVFDGLPLHRALPLPHQPWVDGSVDATY
jgi:methylmalonyl-CoA mutase N-terminal domain/subunit